MTFHNFSFTIFWDLSWTEIIYADRDFVYFESWFLFLYVDLVHLFAHEIPDNICIFGRGVIFRLSKVFLGCVSISSLICQEGNGEQQKVCEVGHVSYVPAKHDHHAALSTASLFGTIKSSIFEERKSASKAQTPFCCEEQISFLLQCQISFIQKVCHISHIWPGCFW